MSSRHNPSTVGKALGWASIGVGMWELLAPRQIERVMGVSHPEATGIIRVLGVRELMHGVDLLSHRDPTKGVWARVAGDMLDSALLVLATKKSSRKSGVAGIFALVSPLVAADILLAPTLTGGKAAKGLAKAAGGRLAALVA